MRGPGKLTRKWKCECGWINYFHPLSEWPEVPRSLYIGWDNNKLMKLYPVPPEEAGQSWAQPYSVRSFVHQTSRGLGGCHYTCRERGKVFDELVFYDICSDTDDEDINAPAWNCHVLAGWSAGQPTCRLWEHVKALCQNDTERNFMQTYLRYVKDRQFPMLIPQVRVGIAERRRPDFVAFVPLQYWRFKWLAIELDHAHGEEHQQSDSVRHKYLEEHNYEVVSLRPNAKGYLEEVKSLVEKFEIWMNLADTDAWEVAVQVEVSHTEESVEPPF
jgi:hypothetical protein